MAVTAYLLAGALSPVGMLAGLPGGMSRRMGVSLPYQAALWQVDRFLALLQ